MVATNNTSNTAWTVGPKIFDALLSYARDMTPQPQLATVWEISPDGLRYTFHLRKGVKWHDGAAFTASDVAFSIQLLKTVHPRGRGTFANVVTTEAPDPYTAIIVLSKAAPYLIRALAATESPIVPRHLFEGTDLSAPPTAKQLVGTGPFRFKEWVPGSHIILDRNPDYWDSGKPYIDQIVMRFITDAAARSAGFQAGELDLGGAAPIPLSEVALFKTLPNLQVDIEDFAYSGNQLQLIFNLDNTYLKDQRVRLAIAHVIDLKRIVQTIFFGFAHVSPSPISVVLEDYYDPAIKPHSVDIALANRILDDAGYKRAPNGIRFPLRLLFNTVIDPRLADYLKQALRPIGLDAAIQSYDFGGYVKAAYTDRAFDLTVESLANAFDPTTGVQRVYWSKNFKVGLPFSNGSHYDSPEADRLLEAAAVEQDDGRRKALFNDFQKLIDTDLPAVNLVAWSEIIIASRKVKNYAPGAEGLNGNFADLYIEP
jgi:peptide/nickel transport system substrate-binding protein